MMRAALVILAVGALSACDFETPENPGWIEDVQPITRANCVRCHGANPSGGAPDRFRLDVFHDSYNERGQLILGAGAMSEWMTVRTSADNPDEFGIQPMPPRFGFSSRQKDTISRWWDPDRNDRPFGTAPANNGRADNQEPTITLLTSEIDARGFRHLGYQIDDADGDTIIGRFLAGTDLDSAVPIAPLHSGRGTVSWDVAAIDGTGRLFAQMNDGTTTVAPLFLSHMQAGNRAPLLAVAGLTDDDVIADTNLPIAVTVTVQNPDAGDNLAIGVVAIRGGSEVPLLAPQLVATGDTAVMIDTTNLTEGPGWTIRVTVSDGFWTRHHDTKGLYISHQATAETFTSIGPLLVARCAECHAGPGRIPGLPIDLTLYEDVGDSPGARSLRGRIYQRVVVQRNMPPSSHELIGLQPITEAERARIADWILGGAPEQ